MVSPELGTFHRRARLPARSPAVLGTIRGMIRFGILPITEDSREMKTGDSKVMKVMSLKAAGEKEQSRNMASRAGMNAVGKAVAGKLWSKSLPWSGELFNASAASVFCR